MNRTLRLPNEEDALVEAIELNRLINLAQVFHPFNRRGLFASLMVGMLIKRSKAQLLSIKLGIILCGLEDHVRYYDRKEFKAAAKLVKAFLDDGRHISLADLGFSSLVAGIEGNESFEVTLDIGTIALIMGLPASGLKPGDTVLVDEIGLHLMLMVEMIREKDKPVQVNLTECVENAKMRLDKVNPPFLLAAYWLLKMTNKTTTEMFDRLCSTQDEKVSEPDKTPEESTQEQ